MAYVNRGGPGPYRRPNRYGSIQPQDYANWGYIILYLVVILGSLLGNGLFLMTVKKNRNLRQTPHLLLATLAVRDLIVTVLVIPFVIDSQAVNLMEWKAGDVMCKFFSFLNQGTMATHAFTLVFLSFFLYFWYRKEESYMTENGQTVVRKTRMHKWAIPLAWVVGLGLAVSSGAIAATDYNVQTGVRTCSVWNGRGYRSNGYKVAVSMVSVAFLVPILLLVFPFIALTMQFFGCREPRLDPPHNRTALTAVLLILVFAATLAPFQTYEAMKLFHQSSAGLKVNPIWSTPYAVWTFDTDIVLNAMIYVACLLHPLLYFIVNPEYRKGLRHVWRDLYCNKDPVQREREEETKRQQRSMQRQYPNRNRAPIIRHNREPLVSQPQPQIMPAGSGGQHYFPYPQNQPPSMQPLLQNNHILVPDQNFIDASFESAMHAQSPQLPPVFEYDGLKYIDTARVEPKIAYSPEKTPPKTPDTPHFGQKPFRTPLDGMVLNQDFGMVMPPVMLGSAQPQKAISPQHFEMADVSPPVATSEPKRSSMTVEDLDGSPGNTLRDRNRRQRNSLSPPVSPTGAASPQAVVEQWTESPGNKNRRRTAEKPVNGHHFGSSSQQASSEMLHSSRPASRSGVEIVITGRTRSRTDLCPDVPRSKFEHSV